MLVWGGHLLSKLLLWRKNPHGRGEDTSTGGPECQAEVRGGGERLGWEQCQGSYPVRDEQKSRGEGYPSQCPQLSTQPRFFRALWPGTGWRQCNVHIITHKAEAASSPGAFWVLVISPSGHCGNQPERRGAGLDCAGGQRGRRQSWLRQERHQSPRKAALDTWEATLIRDKEARKRRAFLGRYSFKRRQTPQFSRTMT